MTDRTTDGVADGALVALAHAAGFSQDQWRAMFYETGPYDSTVPTLAMQTLARLILRHQRPRSPEPGEQSPCEHGNIGPCVTCNPGQPLERLLSGRTIEPGELQANLPDDPAILKRIIMRHVKWRQAALGLFQRVNPKWRELNEFLEASTARIVQSKEVCPNCDTDLPGGCGGAFKDDGDACLLNRQPETKGEKS